VAIHLNLLKREARLVQSAGAPRRCASRDDKPGSSLAAPPQCCACPRRERNRSGRVERSREAFGLKPDEMLTHFATTDGTRPNCRSRLGGRTTKQSRWIARVHFAHSLCV